MKIFKLIKIAWYFISTSPRRLIVVFLIGLLLSISVRYASLGFDFLVGDIINKVNAYIGGGDINEIYLLLLYVLLLGILTTILNNLISYFNRRRTEYSAIESYSRYLEKISSLDPAHFEDNNVNNHIQKATDGYQWRLEDLFRRTHSVIRGIILGLSTLVIILSISPIILVPIILTSTLLFYVRNATTDAKWGVWEANTEIKRRFYDSVSYLSTESSITQLRHLGAKDKFTEIVKNTFNQFYSEEEKVARKRILIEGFFEIIKFFAIAFAIAYLVIQATNGVFEIGLLVFYISVIRNFDNTFDSLMYDLVYWRENLIYLESFYIFEHLKPRLKDTGKEIGAPSSTSIEFNNIDFKYKNSRDYIFKDFSLKINAGENVAIVGANGAGKTSLVKLLTRYYDVRSGEILINGKNIKKIGKKSLFKHFSILTQDFGNFALVKLRENIGLSNLDDVNLSNERIHKLLEISNSQDILEKLPNKYDQILDKRYEGGVDLSGGQWQKIAISRAFFRDAPIIILDEPTSAIDAVSEEKIFENIFEVARDKTVIIISHRFSTVRRADRIIVLKDGQIVEDGTHEELLKLDGEYAHSYNLQAKAYVT